MLILGLETSCDETGVALYDTGRGLLAHALFSQVDIHVDYGGVVPELASRDHVRKTLPLLRQVLDEAGCQPEEIDGIAYTAGPGLVGALMVGATLARALAWSWGVPVLGVHHMEGHLLAPMLEEEHPAYPFVALLVSGGHSQLVRVDGIGRYTMLGESLDDAAGEAFDKTARMLGLPYPGGPHIARAFEEAVVDTLVIKCRRALRQENLKTLVIAGGVSANRNQRARLEKAQAKERARVFYPAPVFWTDNGAMIAYAGAQRLQAGERDSEETRVRPRWPMTELPPIGEPGGA